MSGYYYDSLTGFYYDSKTEYFYNSKSSQWMFWSSKYGTYIPCEGGDQDLKKRLQADEKNEQKIRNAAVISASPKSATTFNNDQVSSSYFFSGKYGTYIFFTTFIAVLKFVVVVFCFADFYKTHTILFYLEKK